MRRLLVLIVTVLTVGSITGSAAASSLRIRTDPNDSRSKLDIHKVITNLSDTTMYLRLRSWDRFRIGHTNDENWKFLLDTFGTRRFDLSVEIFNGMHGFVCVVEAGHGHLIGHRRATRPDRRSVACHLPRGWFGISIERFVSGWASSSLPPETTGTSHPTTASIAGSR